MTDGGQITFGNPGYLTPTSIPDETGCRTFQIPASTEWYGLFMAAVLTLTNEWNWSQSIGGIEIGDAAAKAWEIINAAYAQAETGQCDANVQTPFWDEATDVEDDEAALTQTWYGEVTNPTAPADELDFVENIIVWTFTGLIALATVEIGSYPAILFATVAPKFVIAMRRGDVGEIIRITLDGQDSNTVDTSAYAAGDIIQIPCIADPTVSPPHQLLIIGSPA